MYTKVLGRFMSQFSEFEITHQSNSVIGRVAHMMYVFPFDIQIEGSHVENCSKKKVVTDICVR